MNPLFVLDSSIFKAISNADAAATFRDLQKMGLVHLPFPEIDVSFPIGEVASNCPSEEVANAKFLVSLTSNGADFAFILRAIGPLDVATSYLDLDRPDFKTFFDGALCKAIRYVFAALVTRNVEKSEFKRKPGRLGPGGRPKHTHVTTLRVPKIRYLHDDPAQPSSGREVRAHFRRGHIRDQACGPGFQERKQIWIEPMFVKADDDYIPQQKEYRVVA